MGLLRSLWEKRQSSKPKSADPINTEIQERTSELIDGIENGTFSKMTDEEQQEWIMDKLMGSRDFYQVMGSFHIAPDLLEYMMAKEEDLDLSQEELEIHRTLKETTRKQVERAEKDCLDFFNGIARPMRDWAIANAFIRKWEIEKTEAIDQIMEGLGHGSGMKDLREKYWWIIPWSFHLAEIVEKAKGECQCNKKNFWEAWHRLTNDGDVDIYIKTLETEQVNYYKCILSD